MLPISETPFATKSPPYRWNVLWSLLAKEYFYYPLLPLYSSRAPW